MVPTLCQRLGAHTLGILVALLLLASACGSSSGETITAAEPESEGSSSSADTDATADDSSDGDSANDDSEGDDSRSDSEPADEAQEASTSNESSGSDLENESPLAAFFGIDIGNNEANQAQFEEMEAQAEIATAECMQALGFDYIPRDQSNMMIFDAGGPGGLDPESDEFIETYGFGITTQRFPQSMVGPDLIGFPDEEMGFGPGGEPPLDPNQDYIDSLSDGARDAYYAALWGTGPTFDPTMSEEEMDEAMQDFAPSGCSNEAREAMFESGPPGGPGEEFFEQFGDQLDDLFSRIESDPRIQAAIDETNACVSGKGLFYEGMEELYERFESKVGSIGMDVMMEDPLVTAGLNPEEMSDEQIRDFYEDLPPPRLSAEDQATLGAAQQEEIELAIAVRDCGGGPIYSSDLFNEVRIDLEQRFLDENREALAEFADN